MGSLVIGVTHTSAGLPVVRVEKDFSGTHLPYNFQITHFYHFCSKYYHLPTFTDHVYLTVGDIERTWLTRSVVPNTLIHFDFYTPCGHQEYHSHWGYLARFHSILLHVDVCARISRWCLYTSPYSYTLLFSIHTGQWQGPAGLFGCCIWIPWRPL